MVVGAFSDLDKYSNFDRYPVRSVHRYSKTGLSMASFIPPDFKPSDQSYKNLRKHGAIPEFVDDQLDYFVTYWTEKKEKKQESGKKASWQMTLQRWMRSALGS